MPSIEELAGSAFSSPMNAALRAGIDAVSGDQTITFVKYSRRVLTLDGSVFWVRSSLLDDSSPSVSIGGSLHIATEKTQGETDASSRTAVIFTSKENAGQSFNGVGPNDILIGSTENDGSTVRFVFSRLGFYQNARIFHYSGVAIYQSMESQIVDDLNDLDLTNQVVSNSLPAWMHLNNYTPFYGFGNQIPLFPSFLVTPNLEPPFGAVHIGPESTEALAGVPWLSKVSSHYQLAKDRVRVTLYGVRNDQAAGFLDCALQYMQDYQVIGLMNSPVIRDEKATQAELGIIAQKKSIEFEVSYQQTSIRNIARQLITKAQCFVQPADSPVFGQSLYEPGPRYVLGISACMPGIQAGERRYYSPGILEVTYPLRNRAIGLADLAMGTGSDSNPS